MATCVGILGALVAGLPVAHVSGWYGPHLVTTVSDLLLIESKEKINQSIMDFLFCTCWFLKYEHVYGSLS